MNNDIYQNLKQNLIDELKGSCYGDYGYIVDIYEILEYKINRIDAENTMGSCMFSVKFSCRLCHPLKNTTIVCKVDKFNKILLRCVNGPINIIITPERINNTKFFRDSNRDLRVQDDKSSRLVSTEDYFLVNIINSTFSNGDKQITSIGFLKDVASQKDIENFFKDLYDNGDSLKSYDDFVKGIKDEE